jgi:hypothetical protein
MKARFVGSLRNSPFYLITHILAQCMFTGFRYEYVLNICARHFPEIPTLQNTPSEEYTLQLNWIIVFLYALLTSHTKYMFIHSFYLGHMTA